MVPRRDSLAKRRGTNGSGETEWNKTVVKGGGNVPRRLRGAGPTNRMVARELLFLRLQSLPDSLASAMLTGMPDPLIQLVRACNPNEALPSSDPRVVDCDQARHGGVAPQLAKDFRRANPDKPIFRLFTGHIGVGKTTELFRLQQLLENPVNGDAAMAVIYFDINSELDPNDLALADLLVLIAAQVAKHGRQWNLAKFNETNRAISRFMDHMGQALQSEVSISGGEVSAGFGSLTAEIKEGSPSIRQKLREAIDQQRTTLRAGLNQMLQDARHDLDSQSRGLVLIIDGLEKLPTNLHESLFIDHCEQLVELDANALYTVPMQLAYHPRFASVCQAFAHHPIPVPMLHTDSEEGLECLTMILRKRCEAAGLTLEEVFDSEQCRNVLCQQTGGHLRHLMMFMESALNKLDALPITRAAVDGALRDYRHSLARQIPGHFWPWLRCFRHGRREWLPDQMPEEIRRDLLHQLLVFEYQNGEPSFDVSPEIRNLKNFQHGELPDGISLPSA